MSSVGQVLDHTIVGVLMRDEECSLQRTTIVVLPGVREHFLVMVVVVLVDGSVEREQNHLRSILWIQSSRDESSILVTEAVGKDTGGSVTSCSEICWSLRDGGGGSGQRSTSCFVLERAQFLHVIKVKTGWTQTDVGMMVYTLVESPACVRVCVVPIAPFIRTHKVNVFTLVFLAGTK
uniref:Uncharacterized protein n=1 Tax=Cacopsylla melanoneura TaxID=428564 RepID=A0A8D8RIQ2_9HEMI